MMICFQGGWAQSLLHSKPLDYNTGFAGSKKFDRISFHLNEMSKTSRNTYFSYDKLVKPLKGGVGFYYYRNEFTNPYYRNAKTLEDKHNVNGVGFAYSPKIILKNKYLLSPSISLGYIVHKDMLLEKIDESTSLFLKENQDIHYFDNKIGLLINSKNFYFGYTFNSQLGLNKFNLSSFQGGYVLNFEEKRNLLIDARYNQGTYLESEWRNYKTQLNLSYNYGILFFGAGLNDQKYISGLLGLKLINLKINAAYHILKSENISNVELGIQYVFNKENEEKINLPFRKWLLKLRM